MRAGAPATLNSVNEVVDATRRTRLANERTMLAWFRSGLTSLAVGFGVGKLVPDLVSGLTWSYVALGVAFLVLGIGMMAVGLLCQRDVERALDRGDFVPLADRVVVGLAAFGTVIGIATIALILYEA